MACHRELTTVRTRPRTARHVRPCRAFRGRVVVLLGSLLLAALSPRVGGVSCRLWASSRIIASKTPLTDRANIRPSVI